MHLNLIKSVPVHSLNQYKEELYFNDCRLGHILYSLEKPTNIYLFFSCKDSGYEDVKHFEVSDLQDIPTKLEAAREFLREYIRQSIRCL